MKKPDTVYQVHQEKERLRKAAAGANGLRESAPAMSADQPPPPLMAPLAAAWPGSTQAPKPNVAKLVSVSFALRKPDAKQVSLSGEFNGWSPNATPMKRRADGQWETTVALAPGQYQYKFIVDGEWVVDPVAQKNVPNECGSLNSVLEVRA